MENEINERERQILILVAEGLTNREIAEKLQLSLHTVKWYLKEIYSKLYVSNRTEAVAYARRQRILQTIETPTLPNTNLPNTLMPFLGREDELKALGDLLHERDVRLITVHGVGGIGKTRLVMEAARSYVNDFRDGVYFVSLTALDDTADVVASIAEAVGLASDGRGSLLVELKDYLHHRKMLLVLDNFEHLPDAAGLVVELLENTSRLTVLVTSRERLNLRGEHVFNIEGLDYPQDGLTAQSITCGSYQMFMQAATTTLSDFQPTPDESQTILRICQLVEGMPLALELAAAWVGVMPVEDILAEVKRNLDFLATAYQDLPSRHRSIRATFDHSWNRLNPAEQWAMARLSVFRAEFTANAVQTIAEAAPFTLKNLLDKALLRQSVPGRFGMHELVRQFAVEHLHTDPTLEVKTRNLHSKYYLELAGRLSRQLQQTLDYALIQEIDAEWENIQQAWRQAIEQGDVSLLQDATAMFLFFEIKCLWLEGYDLLQQALDALGDGDPTLHGRLLVGRALMNFRQNETEQSIQDARTAFDLLGDMRNTVADRANAHAVLGYGLLLQGQLDEAAQHLDDAVTMAQESENSNALGLSRRLQSLLAWLRGDANGAVEILEEQRLLHPPSIWGGETVRFYLGENYFNLGEADRARVVLQEALDIARQHRAYEALVGSAYYLHRLDPDADQSIGAVFELMRALVGNRTSNVAIGRTLLHLGNTFFFRGQRQHAYDLLGIGMLMIADNAGEILPAHLLDVAGLMVGADEYERAGKLAILALSNPNGSMHEKDTASNILKMAVKTGALSRTGGMGSGETIRSLLKEAFTP